MGVIGHIPARNASHGRSASIWDVARVAGVSQQTVSRVINGKARVSEATRAKVLRVIADLGYRPNRLVRTLAGGPARSVTVPTSDTALYGAAATLRGMEEAARTAGGVDDAPPSACLNPSLTTVRLDFEGPGRACFGLLHHRLEPQTAPSMPTWSEPELIGRESSGPPPA